jgi:hypothetical protein
MTEQPEQAVNEEPPALPTTECTICTHPEAAAIDEQLLIGTSLRAIAGTFGVARSSVQRHRANHLSVQAITDEPVDAERKPLRLVDVHGQLATLADRLEKVVELATRTRKAPAAVAAMRELRSTLEAIMRIQADPGLQKAASLEELQGYVMRTGTASLVRMFEFILEQFGFDFRSSLAGRLPEREQILARLMADCLRSLAANGVDTGFAEVDTVKARAYVEGQALERAARVEAEVQRRVEAELRRREAQARPAIEAHVRRAIEGGAPVWGA